MAKVLVVVPFPMSEENRHARASQLRSVKLGPGIEFDFRPVRAAPANYTSEHDSVLADVSILDACKAAQAEGYDAVCIDTMSDSGLAAARSVLDIPVIGPGRASMLTALMLGERFSILIMWDRWRHLYRKTIAELGLGRASPRSGRSACGPTTRRCSPGRRRRCSRCCSRRPSNASPRMAPR
jgi:allantoin racemase